MIVYIHQANSTPNGKEVNKIVGTWKQYIESLQAEFIGKKVMYDGKPYTVALVDYNGIIHINKPTAYNKTTAVYEPHEARKYLM